MKLWRVEFWVVQVRVAVSVLVERLEELPPGEGGLSSDVGLTAPTVGKSEGGSAFGVDLGVAVEVGLEVGV